VGPSERDWRCENGPQVAGVEADRADYSACVLGLRDYVNKNGFPGVVLGLSGGIDSALCAAMAVDALGAERVRCIMLPYKFTSQESLKDAAACAKALGVRYEIVPIAAAVEGFESAWRRLSQDCHATSLKKICKRARAARFLWRFRTNSISWW
jgi:NAD+ synthase